MPAHMSALSGSLCAMLIACGMMLPSSSAQAEPRWQNTVWLLADNKYKAKRHRDWQELDQQEKQRIYRRHKQFQEWPIEEQRRVCSTYFEQTGEKPPACRKKK